MRPTQSMLLLLTLWVPHQFATGDEPSTEPLVKLTTEQARFLLSLDGKWIPKEVLVGGKPFKDKVALESVLVKQSKFEFVTSKSSKSLFKCTRISTVDQTIDLVTLVDATPVRYLMRLDGNTMWLVTKANDKYETEWTAKPTKYNLCILLEREPKENSQTPEK